MILQKKLTSISITGIYLLLKSQLVLLDEFSKFKFSELSYHIPVDLCLLEDWSEGSSC